MNPPLASILAFALLGADDPKAQTTQPPHSPITITVTISDPLAKPQEPVKVSAILAPKVALPSPMPTLVPPPKLAAVHPRETWPLSLADAIRIALDNNDIVRVIGLGAKTQPAGGSVHAPEPAPAYTTPMLIARADDATSITQFKSEVMAQVREVERQYWNLALANAQLHAAEQTLKGANESLAKEQAESTGCFDASDCAEITQQLENFRLAVVARTSDAISAERALRAAIGLPTADHRQIVTATTPTGAPLEHDWESCCKDLAENQPDVVACKLALATDDPAASTRKRKIKHRLVKKEAALKQLLHEKTLAMARSFVEADTFQKEYLTAKRSRIEATESLEAQCDRYEKGQIDADRFLDIVSAHSAAVAAEYESQVAYNNALADLCQAKGTLLADRGIVVADNIHHGHALVAASSPSPSPSDSEARAASFEPDSLIHPASIPPMPPVPLPPPPAPHERQETWIGAFPSAPASFEPEPLIHPSSLPPMPPMPLPPAPIPPKLHQSGTAAFRMETTPLFTKAASWSLSFSFAGLPPLSIKGTLAPGSQGETKPDGH